MSKRQKGLGKGLAALIPQVGLEEGELVREVELGLIEPNPYQPREEFDEEKLVELVQSIKSHGILQPVVVRKKDDGFQLVIGERRLLAAKKAGLKRIPVVVRDYSNRDMLELSLIENLQRVDINPVEAAQAYKRLIEDFKITQNQLAQRIGKSRVAITNTLRLLNLPVAIQESVKEGKISEGHARALLTLEDRGKLLNLWRRVLRFSLSVRATERAARAIAAGKKTVKRSRAELDPDVVAIKEWLQRVLGTKVEIKPRGGERGVLEIHYFSAEDLERIVELIGQGQRQPHKELGDALL